MQPNKVVIRLKDGTIAKGQTNDFFPNRPTFHLTTFEDKIEEFKTEELKAVFFVKDCNGDTSYEYSYFLLFTHQVRFKIMPYYLYYRPLSKCYDMVLLSRLF